MHGFCRNFQHYTGFVYYLFFSFKWVLSFLYVYSHHSILECYNLFSGVELSMRSFFVIIIIIIDITLKGLRCFLGKGLGERWGGGGQNMLTQKAKKLGE